MTDKRIKQIADYNGLPVIYNKSFEELGELTTALARYQAEERKYYEGIVEDLLIHGEARQNLIDELADVQIMIKQITYACNVEKEVNDMVQYKINRQLERMGEEMTNDEAEKILMDMVNNNYLDLYDDEKSAVSRAIEAIRENKKLKQALEACD